MGISPFDGIDSIMFQIIPVIVIVGFVLTIGAFLVHAVQGAKEWKKNNDSPILSVDAAVVAKRADVQYFHHRTGTDNMDHVSSSTTYYVSFEVASGDRIEFKIRDIEYGMLAENDMGKLTFQGTRYLGFERDKRESMAS